MVKEAIFSVIAPFAPFERVLDLYAGSGALGIEAMSRWGGEATFVDESQEACAALRRNLEHTHLRASAIVLRRKVERALADLKGPFALVLADPPYGDTAIVDVMERLGRPGFVEPGGIVVLEHGVRTQPATRYATLSYWKSRRHGDTVISMFLPDGSTVPAAPYAGKALEE